MSLIKFENLKKDVKKGKIDTVLVCGVDMQGRLIGKRFHAHNFIEHSWQETHCCDYLLATDIEMATIPGYAASSWELGYGDYVMKPDLTTLRPIPWLENTVMVICDFLDHHTHSPISHAPREMLKKQIGRLKKLGFNAMAATELEFFLFKQTIDEIYQDEFRTLKPISEYNQDYHILQTTKNENIFKPIRNHLFAAGIPVENSKGEAETGQQELNIRYDEALKCADHHTIAKHGVKEIAWQQGHAVSFMAKWTHQKVGSATHIHQSLWKNNGEAAFYDKKDPLSMSQLMRHYLAGLIKYMPEYTYFLAPYVNSYKRFVKGTFAPTKIAWSIDNRTAAFRICGSGTKAVRIECRIGGADLNPYLTLSAMLAAGIEGIENKLQLSEAMSGDLYYNDSIKDIPNSLNEAIENLQDSAMLKNAMGEEVIAHYTRAAKWEQEEFDRVVTDWELKRGFERA